MNNTESPLSPAGSLVKFLLDGEEMNKFEFSNLLDILVNMWAVAQYPLWKCAIDYVIIASINQRDFKNLSRRNFIKMTYLLVPVKVKTASLETINNYYDNSGLDMTL